MKKYVVTIMIVLMFVAGYVFANDCISVIELEKNWAYTHVMPEVAFKKATSNLKKFCCSENSLKSDLDYCNDVVIDGNFPASAYLFDHLLDVFVRRLDAKEKNINGEDLVYGLTPDADGQEWRIFITDRANNYKGVIPLEIYEKYRTMREIRGQNLLTEWTTSHTKMPWSSNNFENLLDWNLGEKFNGTCEIVTYMYMSKLGIENNQKVYNAYKNCKNMISQRVDNEYTYTQSILSKQGNNLLIMNINNYFDKMFVQDKLTKLQSLMSSIKGLFAEIVKAVSQLTRNCS